MQETSEQIATAKNDVVKTIGRIQAGRFSGRMSTEIKQDVWLRINSQDVMLSAPINSEGAIYGLELVAKMARSGFYLFTLGDYDKARFWSDEIDC